MYKGGSFEFSFNINANYPHEPPKVKCKQVVRIAMMLYVPKQHSLTSPNRRLHKDLPPQRRSRGKCLLEHPPRRLEASSELELRYGRTSISLP